MKGKVKCSCGHSWSKSDSSKEDMNVCHICGKDNTMKEGGWLDKYQDGGELNYNDSNASAGPGFQGDGYSNVGRNYSPAWGGQFKDGGKLSFIKDPKLRNMLEGYKPELLQTIDDYRLPEGYMAGSIYPSTEVSTSIGGEDGEPAYLIPSFKYGYPLQDPVQEFDMTGQYLGGPFKTWQDAEKFQEIRHQYVEKGQPLPSPITTSNMAMGGSLPGATGSMYARVGAPSKGTHRNQTDVTDASAQDGIKTTLNKSETDRDIFNDVSSSLFFNKNTINNNTVSSIKKEMSNYISSPLYVQRQSNYPEQYNKITNINDDGITYIKGLNDPEEQKKYETTIAKSKREQRLNNLNTVPVNIHNKSIDPEWQTRHSGLTNIHDNFYDPNLEQLNLSGRNFSTVVAHELSHATARNSTDTMYAPEGSGLSRYPESDRVNTKYWDSIVSKRKKPFNLGTGLNTSEIDQFVNLAKPLTSPEFSGIPHHDKTSERTKFSTEQYGDLNSVRHLLHSKGITKSFGEDLDKDKIEKALQNKQIKDDPNFKRFHFRYGTDNLIKLNNTIAANNPKQGMPIAQNGMEMKFYQNGLDFKPKSISKNGSQIIKDDRGQWDHPGEITEIGSNQITMQGVPYPVLGISDTGDTQMMYPNQEYEFIGESVTEYPIMQDGGMLDSIINLGKRAVNYIGGLFDDDNNVNVNKDDLIGYAPTLKTSRAKNEYDKFADIYYHSPQRKKVDRVSMPAMYDDVNIPDYSKDENRIKLGTGRFSGANVSSKLIDDIAAAAKRNNIPVGQLLTLAGRESTFGQEKGKNINSGNPRAYTSGWNIDEKYQPYEPKRFLADKKVPGINVIKSPNGYQYEVTNQKAIVEHLKKNPQLINEYKKKIESTPDIGNRNSFDLSAEFLKEKGVQGYNPRDPKYVEMFNKDYDTLKQDKALMSYLKKKGYTYEQGGQLTKLDQLTNFTNYNTKQPGGWLDKYQ